MGCITVPDSPLTVGIDGGYVHARDGDNGKAGWFELIVGKSVLSEGDAKCFPELVAASTDNDIIDYSSPTISSYPHPSRA
jgi:hypothetical protein